VESKYCTGSISPFFVLIPILCSFLKHKYCSRGTTKESTTGLSLYAVTKFRNDKHTLEQRILPSKVWHLNWFILFSSNNGIGAKIGLVGKVVCSLCEAGSKWIQPFLSCCLEFIFDKMTSVIVICHIILFEANPCCDGWWMHFLMICVCDETGGEKFIRTCIKWKQYSVKGDSETRTNE